MSSSSPNRASGEGYARYRYGLSALRIPNGASSASDEDDDNDTNYSSTITEILASYSNRINDEEGSVSSMSQETHTTDNILLWEGNSAGVLALEGPQADDATVDRPLQPPARPHHHYSLQQPPRTVTDLAVQSTVNIVTAGQHQNNNNNVDVEAARQTVLTTQQTVGSPTSVADMDHHIFVEQQQQQQQQQQQHDKSDDDDSGRGMIDKSHSTESGGVEEATLPTSDFAPDEKDHNDDFDHPISTSTSRRRWKIWCAVLAIIFLVAAIAVAIPFALNNENSRASSDNSSNNVGSVSVETTLSPTTWRPSSSPSLPPSLTPSTQPTNSPSTSAPSSPPSNVPSSAPTSLEAAVTDLILAASPDTATALANPESPQSLAFTWLLENTSFALHSPGKILQRFALATLYYSTAGDQWTDRAGWLVNDSDECTWFNQVLSPCTASGQYVFLELSGNNLRGTLPDELALLGSSLLTLIVRDNALTGGIPSTFGQLTKLVTLDLASNALTLPLPTTALGDMVRLEKLSVMNNPAITGPIPQEELTSLVNLKELYLAQTSLQGSLDGFCINNTETTTTARLDELWADCDQVSCPCCTRCCFDNVGFCT